MRRTRRSHERRESCAGVSSMRARVGLGAARGGGRDAPHALGRLFGGEIGAEGDGELLGEELIAFVPHGVLPRRDRALARAPPPIWMLPTVEKNPARLVGRGVDASSRDATSTTGTRRASERFDPLRSHPAFLLGRIRAAGPSVNHLTGRASQCDDDRERSRGGRPERRALNSRRRAERRPRAPARRDGFDLHR